MDKSLEFKDRWNKIKDLQIGHDNYTCCYCHERKLSDDLRVIPKTLDEKIEKFTLCKWCGSKMQYNVNTLKYLLSDQYKKDQEELERKIEESKARKKAHQLYLQSEAWAIIRQKRIEFDSFMCANCGDKKNLYVHHLTYENWKNENLEDLITLCKKCHFLVHKKHRNHP